jgi:hypothetical protein
MNQSDVSLPDFEAAPKDAAADPNLPAAAAWKSVFNLATEPRWQLAQRIVASRSFAKSVLLSRFLLYVCEREITGKTAEISEHQIGVHVFGRRPGYHPGEDNIVRNYARQLRQRLDQYFSGQICSGLFPQSLSGAPVAGCNRVRNGERWAFGIAGAARARHRIGAAPASSSLAGPWLGSFAVARLSGSCLGGRPSRIRGF